MTIWASSNALINNALEGEGARPNKAKLIFASMIELQDGVLVALKTVEVPKASETAISWNVSALIETVNQLKDNSHDRLKTLQR